MNRIRISKIRAAFVVPAMVAALAVGACTPSERDGALTGAAVGGLGGAAVGGLATGRVEGALVGGAAGAAGGAVVGSAVGRERDRDRYYGRAAPRRCYFDEFGDRVGVR